MCGEKPLLFLGGLNRAGSPPRMRGKGGIHLRLPEGDGITPACAGKSLDHSSLYRANWDHPRMCGEKPSTWTWIPQELGSPPHVRGKGSNLLSLGQGFRITPACAGKSRPLACADIVQEDHPRMCGEKAPQLHAFGVVMGSPPHVRGKVLGIHFLCRHLRITPAHAGKRYGTIKRFPVN